jgi:hypothetical protein
MNLILLSNLYQPDSIFNAKDTNALNQVCRSHDVLDSGNKWENLPHRNRTRSKVIIKLIDTVRERVSSSFFVHKFTAASG